MKNRTEIERAETLNCHIFCEKLIATKTELNRQATELEQRAKKLRNMADYCITAESILWHNQFEKVKGNEIEDFWAWVFNDKDWEKHKDKYNYRTLKDEKI